MVFGAFRIRAFEYHAPTEASLDEGKPKILAIEGTGSKAVLRPANEGADF